MGRPDLPVTWEEDGYTADQNDRTGRHQGAMPAAASCATSTRKGCSKKSRGTGRIRSNQGHICPRCACLPDVVNSPDRLLHPMKRDPSRRGDPDAWEQITWEEACFDLVYERMTALAQEYGAHTLQTFCGTGRDILWQSQRLAYAMGTPHVESYSSGLACWMPRLVSYNVSTGDYMMPDCSECHEDRFDNPEYRDPEVIFCWGNNCVASSSDGFFGDWLVEVYAAWVEAGRRGPAAHMAGRASRHLDPAAPCRRFGRGACHAQGHHRRGSVRSRISSTAGPDRLRSAVGTLQRIRFRPAARTRLGACREDPGSRAPFRGRTPHGGAAGAGAGHAAQRHRRRARHHFHAGHLRRHRPARRPDIHRRAVRLPLLQLGVRTSCPKTCRKWSSVTTSTRSSAWAWCSTSPI